MLLLLLSCSSPNTGVNINKDKLDFNRDLNFDEFNTLLKEYNKTSPYPSLNK